MERTVHFYARVGNVAALGELLGDPDAEVEVDEVDDFGVTALMVRAGVRSPSLALLTR